MPDLGVWRRLTEEGRRAGRNRERVPIAVTPMASGELLPASASIWPRRTLFSVWRVSTAAERSYTLICCRRETVTPVEKRVCVDVNIK